jgi:hypothetical protein
LTANGILAIENQNNARVQTRKFKAQPGPQNSLIIMRMPSAALISSPIGSVPDIFVFARKLLLFEA